VLFGGPVPFHAHLVLERGGGFMRILRWTTLRVAYMPGLWYATPAMQKRHPSHPIRLKPNSEAIRKAALKQAIRLFPDNQEWQTAFVDSIVSGEAGRPSLFWTAPRPAEPPFALTRLTDWQPIWTDTIDEPGSVVGQHPLYDEGAYYVLDFSSIVSASVLMATNTPVASILDLCSAPGGKGIFAWRLLEPELLVCNEVIGKRHGMLISNLQRCKVSGSCVTQMDPAKFAELTPQSFDLVIVDAPCSGQSLPAKGTDAPGAFQSEMVSMNMSRQRRILANAVETVKPGGYLAYMTCTYSREENEKNLEWVLRRFPQFEAVVVPHLESFRSPLLEAPCYRHSPQNGLGVGGFTCLLRNTTAYRPTISLNEIHKRIRPVWEA